MKCAGDTCSLHKKIYCKYRKKHWGRFAKLLTNGGKKYWNNIFQATSFYLFKYASKVLPGRLIGLVML